MLRKFLYHITKPPQIKGNVIFSLYSKIISNSIAIFLHYVISSHSSYHSAFCLFMSNMKATLLWVFPIFFLRKEIPLSHREKIHQKFSKTVHEDMKGDFLRANDENEIINPLKSTLFRYRKYNTFGKRVYEGLFWVLLILLTFSDHFIKFLELYLLYLYQFRFEGVHELGFDDFLEDLRAF